MMRPVVLAALLTAVAAPAATGNASFAYRWPQAANRYPALVAWLTADRERLRAGTLREAAADARAARAEGSSLGVLAARYGVSRAAIQRVEKRRA